MGLDDINLAWHGLIKSDYPALYELLGAVQKVHGDSMMAYLTYMSIRIMEMKRVLKKTGNICVHCDTAASHYLKLLLDALFQHANFECEVIWRRTGSHNSTRSFGRMHETILWYHKSQRYTFNVVRTPYTKGHVESRYTIGPDGRARFSSGGNVLTGAGATGGLSCEPWRGFDPASKGRHWAVPRYFERHMDSDYLSLSPVDKLEALYKKGLVEIKEGTVWPVMVRYLDERDGVPLGDIWAYQSYTEGTLWGSDEGIDSDVKWLGPTDPERTGYPTQKPVGLLRRIIKALSDPGDMVLDPFCGCASACIAAESEQRQWAGIDISPKAAELVRSRMHEELGLFFNGAHRTDIPQRTDLGSVPRYNSQGNKRYLYGEQGGYCNGCGEHFQPRHFHVDHIIPRAKGGTDHISNLQLLCGSCNAMKGDRPQEELLAKLIDKGWIKRHRSA
ncbi:MAG: DNA methyltransferase [Spirochaetaceae bacterium]|nr:DNA methyltransferase [Spirochaetaceae bacterium]